MPRYHIRHGGVGCQNAVRGQNCKLVFYALLVGYGSNPDFPPRGRTSASAECRHWSGTAVRWPSCAILLSPNAVCFAYGFRITVLGMGRFLTETVWGDLERLRLSPRKSFTQGQRLRRINRRHRMLAKTRNVFEIVTAVGCLIIAVALVGGFIALTASSAVITSAENRKAREECAASGAQLRYMPPTSSALAGAGVVPLSCEYGGN